MNAYINTAIKVARRVGDMMLRSSNDLGNIRVDKKAFNDFVSEVDKKAEAMIIEGLLEVFPTHHILSEESGDHGYSNSEFQWIIDPLDGTTNYLHHHPQYAISIALLQQGQLKQAVIFAPEKNELYVSSRGEGAFVNERRLRVSKRSFLSDCLIGTGFPVVNQEITPIYLGILQDVMQTTAGVRREGAASLDLCQVARGRFDGYFEFNLKPWDIAAGALIVREAGGFVTDTDGEEHWLESGNITAGNAKILAQLLQLIGKHLPAGNK